MVAERPIWILGPGKVTSRRRWMASLSSRNVSSTIRALSSCDQRRRRSAQNLDPHRPMTLKLDLRSHASRNTRRQTRRRSSEARRGAGDLRQGDRAAHRTYYHVNHTPTWRIAEPASPVVPVRLTASTFDQVSRCLTVGVRARRNRRRPVASRDANSAKDHIRASDSSHVKLQAQHQAAPLFASRD